MFFTFLNREVYQSIDLSSLLYYRPEQIIPYYYNSCIELPFESYRALQESMDSNGEPDTIAAEWINLMEEDLKCHRDLLNLKDNEFIHQLGPYYHVPTNTRFYFSRESSSLPLTASDFSTIMELKTAPVPDQILHKYNKSRKNARKAARNKEELLEDLNMCITALQQTEVLNRHINYLNKFLEMRYAIIQKEDLAPAEPDNLPDKPQKAADNEKGLNNLILFSRTRPKTDTRSGSSYNHDMKVYFIRYREYEKACERYKEALEQWVKLSGSFMDACMEDIGRAEHQLRSARRILSVYNNIISRSFVHLEYQDIQTLSTFKHYLETGRCMDLQDCMNVWADEKHWSEIKASQERIENTIYFLQNDNEYVRYADQKINKMLNRLNNKSMEEQNNATNSQI
ncbi:MAG TPA: hypothetical protein VHQ70_02330 [Syntrophomonadaceae bacterium]|nr:hypothetical protein [Syntrophomonadaceae bacterium]